MPAAALPVVAMLVAVEHAEPPPKVAVLVVEFEAESKFIGLPEVCPGSDPNEARADEVCTAELYDAPVRVVRHIGGARLSGHSLRFPGHALRVRQGARMLVLAQPWKSGWLFASWWDRPDARGEVCLDAEQAGHLRITSEWSRWRARTIMGEGDGVSYPMRCLRL